MSAVIKAASNKCALVMAGGTGGHIFPGLAVADELRERGWRVHWLGAPGSMEEQLVPPRGYAFEPVVFGGVRGKGAKTLFLLPLRLLRAFGQSMGVIRRVKPDVLVAKMVLAPKCGATLLYRFSLMSKRSATASITKSHPPSKAKSSS